jgi:hypothetical protein
MKTLKWLMRVAAWGILPSLVGYLAHSCWGSLDGNLGAWVAFIAIPGTVMYGLVQFFPGYSVSWDPVGPPLFWGLGFLVQGLLLERVEWACRTCFRRCAS